MLPVQQEVQRDPCFLVQFMHGDALAEIVTSAAPRPCLC